MQLRGSDFFSPSCYPKTVWMEEGKKISLKEWEIKQAHGRIMRGDCNEAVTVQIEMEMEKKAWNLVPARPIQVETWHPRVQTSRSGINGKSGLLYSPGDTIAFKSIYANIYADSAIESRKSDSPCGCNGGGEVAPLNRRWRRQSRWELDVSWSTQCFSSFSVTADIL